MPTPVQVEYTAQIWQEGDQFVAHAMPLDVISSGIDPEEARKALAEAVELFLTTAREMGTLDDILHECGYVDRREAWSSPPWVSIERHMAAVGA